MLQNLIFNGKDDDNKSLITQLKIENQINQGTRKDEHIIAIGGNDLDIDNMFLYIITRFLKQHNEHNLSNILEIRNDAFKNKYSLWFYVELECT